MNEIEPHVPGQQHCPSDMLSALENLERMFHACRSCMNAHASNAVLLAIGVEAQMLALKMKAMLGRWNIYLPFHEVMDVNFAHWQANVSEWIEVLQCKGSEELERKYPWLTGCTEYMLDLYAQTEFYDIPTDQMLPRAPEFFKVSSKDDYRQEVSAYMELTDELLDEMEQTDNMSDDWRGEVARMATRSLIDEFVNDRTMLFSGPEGRLFELECGIREKFDMLSQMTEAVDWALMALGTLQNQLCDLQALFCKALPNEMFIRLSMRLFYRHCLPSYHEGEVQVNKWCNGWPENKLKKNAEKKKEELRKQLMAKPYGGELQEYISLDAPDLFGDSSFGRFLHTNRKELRVDDLKYIHKVCRELNLLNGLIIGQGGSSVQTHSAPIRQIDAAEKDILQKVAALAKRAEWINISEDAAVTALHKALGLGPVFPDARMVQMSQSLWSLLKKRRGCDAEKSLMVTWLNIVGYCVSRGLLGGGSPALARRFFPRCGKDDYKAIDKGRNAENNKNFLAIVPLLDACFRALKV